MLFLILFVLGEWLCTNPGSTPEKMQVLKEASPEEYIIANGSPTEVVLVMPEDGSIPREAMSSEQSEIKNSDRNRLPQLRDEKAKLLVVQTSEDKDLSAADYEFVDRTTDPELRSCEISTNPDHQLFGELLKKYVSAAGKVDYAGLSTDESKLDQYLSILEKNLPEDSWSRNQQLAYWINAYNAFTIKLILDHYPVVSIMDIDDGKPWETKWIELGDRTFSLNHIEHEIIRPQFNEPRIHFAVNCAAKSCPPLANLAFTEQNIDDLLIERTKNFINNTEFNTFKKDQASISKIFEWYASDFGDLVSFLNRYSDTKIDSGARISFKEYNWRLNN